MKIKVLKIKNFKKIKELVVEPKDNVIVIAGENASGKTSALDAIEWGLGGEGLGKKKIAKPVRKGTEKAEVIMEIDNFIVRKYCKNNKIYSLRVTNEDRTIKYPSPQVMLDNFVGKLSFDPRKFMMLSAKEQRSLLLEAFGLKKKLDKIEEKRQSAYDERTIVNKDVKTYEGQLKGLKQPRKDLPEEPISLTELSKNLEVAKDWNDKLEGDKEEFKDIGKEIKEYQAEIETLTRRKKKLKKILKGKEFKDLEIIRTEMAEAEGLNEEIRNAEKYQQVYKFVIDKKRKSKKLTNSIASLDEKALKLLQDKKIPVKNLTIQKEGISFRNIPYNQLADSEKLKISIWIAMILNPKLKVIRITDANLFDSKSMGIIEKMAKKFKYQMWLERISEDEFADIILVNGEVKEVK